MTPDEVRRLQAFAQANGRSLTVNPTTGLPEAGMLSDLFKMVAPIALGAFLGPGAFGIAGLGMSAGMAGAAVGGLTTLATGSLSRGLMAGLGAYGGAGMAYGLEGAGANAMTTAGVGDYASSLAEQGIYPTLADGAVNPAFGEGASQIALESQRQALAAPMTDRLSAGFSAATASPSAMGSFAKDNLKYLAAAASPIAADLMTPTTTKMPDITGNTGYIRQKVYDPYTQTYRSMAPVKANEWGDRQFSDIHRGYNGGGIVALAGGGGFSNVQEDGGYSNQYDDGSAAAAATKAAADAAAAAAAPPQGIATLTQPGFSDAQVKDWFLANQGASDKTIADAMSQFKVGTEQIARATGTMDQLGDYNKRFVQQVAQPDTTASQFLTKTADVGLQGQALADALGSSGLSAASQYALTNADVGGLAGLSTNINKALADPNLTLTQAQTEMNKYGLSDADVLRATGRSTTDIFDTRAADAEAKAAAERNAAAAAASKMAADRAAADKLAADKAAADKAAAEKAIADQLAAEKAAADKIAADKFAADKAAADKAAADAAAAKIAGDMDIAAKIAADEKAAAERAAAAKAILDAKIKKEKDEDAAARLKGASDKAAYEKYVADKAAADAAAEKAAREKAIADKLAADKLAADKLAADKLAAEKAAAEKAAAAAAAAKAAADKAAADKIAADKLAADKLAADKLAADKIIADAAAAKAANDAAIAAAAKAAADKAIADGKTAAETAAAAAAAKLAAEKAIAEEKARLKAIEDKKAADAAAAANVVTSVGTVDLKTDTGVTLDKTDSTSTGLNTLATTTPGSIKSSVTTDGTFTGTSGAPATVGTTVGTGKITGTGTETTTGTTGPIIDYGGKTGFTAAPLTLAQNQITAKAADTTAAQNKQLDLYRGFVTQNPNATDVEHANFLDKINLSPDIASQATPLSAQQMKNRYYDAKYNKMTGDSQSAYNFLMGKGAYPTKSGVGEIMRPYKEATLGMPASTNQKYIFDPATKSYQLNRDYVGSYRDAKGAVNYTMSPNEIFNYFVKNAGQADSVTYDWAIENNISPEEIAASTGVPLSTVAAKWRDAKAKKDSAAKTTADKVAADKVAADKAVSSTEQISDGSAAGGLMALANGGITGSGQLNLNIPLNLGGSGGGGGGFAGGYSAMGSGFGGYQGQGSQNSVQQAGMPEFRNQMQDIEAQIQKLPSTTAYSDYTKSIGGRQPTADEMAQIEQLRKGVLGDQGFLNLQSQMQSIGSRYQQQAAGSQSPGLQQRYMQQAPNARMYANGGATGYALGGLGALGSYSDGGRLLRGPGDGVSDSIPATIGRKQQPARLADGEFVVPARIVSELGNGSTEAGAKKLYAMMDRVQRARGKTTGKDKVAANSRADKHLPA